MIQKEFLMIKKGVFSEKEEFLKPPVWTIKNSLLDGLKFSHKWNLSLSYWWNPPLEMIKIVWLIIKICSGMNITFENGD
jgi:hypothetical protein